MVHSTDTVIVGGGQAGLSLAHHLAVARRPHVVLERGRVGERWHSARWDSLRLLTPNWLNRLDGGAVHRDADGFLAGTDFARYLARYARRLNVREHVSVVAAERRCDGFRVLTDAGEWHARNLVIATGDAAEPAVPAAARTAPSWLRALHSSGYRNPAQLQPGGVLVVGAGPSGQQIAAELRRAGRDVVLAAGRHSRVVRRYRGRDIWHWLDLLGDLDVAIEEHPNPAGARRTPNLTLTGANGGEQLDLDVLGRLGVTIAGRIERFDAGRAVFAPDLERDVADSERRLHRLVDRIDELVADSLPDWPHDAEPVAAVRLDPSPPTIDLAARGISTAIWATGYRRDYGWLRVPALDEGGELVHRHGLTEVPGLSVIGLRFQRRRSSHIIGGVGRDAAFLAEWVAAREAPRRRSPMLSPRTA